MRWKWIVPRLLIAFSIWAFIHWGMDPLLRWTAVSALQSVTGARVDIRRVVTTFFPPSIDIQQTAVARNDVARILDPEAALQRARDLAEHLERHPDLPLSEVAATLMRGRALLSSKTPPPRWMRVSVFPISRKHRWYGRTIVCNGPGPSLK